MISGNLNLRQLRSEIITTKKGTKCIVIPIEDNDLTEGEKGVYLNLVGFEFEDKTGKEYKDTHILKQSLPKEKRSEQTPILGTMRVSGGAVATPNNSNEDYSSTDDLPF